MDEDEQTENDNLANSSKSVNTKFVASKWETVDPEKLEKQAITTSKWDFFDDSNSSDKGAGTDGNNKNLTSYDMDDDNTNNSSNQKNDANNNKDESDFDDDDIDGKPMDDDDEL